MILARASVRTCLVLRRPSRTLRWPPMKRVISLERRGGGSQLLEPIALVLDGKRSACLCFILAIIAFALRQDVRRQCLVILKDQTPFWPSGLSCRRVRHRPRLSARDRRGDIHTKALFQLRACRACSSLTEPRRRELAITETDDNAIAAAAIIGDKRSPEIG